MRIMPHDAFQKAEDFIFQQARPLEQARLKWHFHNGGLQDVATALQSYQNPDGGFGNAIEPDFRLPDSSPLATTVGLQTAVELDLPAGHPVVSRAMQYLLSTHDPGRGYWPAVPLKVNDYPHAPWWRYDDRLQRCLAESPANPTAEVVAYFHRFESHVRSSFLERITTFSLQHLDSLHDPLNMNDMICYLRLAEVLPRPRQARILARLRQAVLKVVSREPSEWAGYVPQPLEFVRSPDSPLFDPLKEDVEHNLDYKINSQNSDGSWTPNWSWFGSYPRAWRQAEQEWQGILTLGNLLALKRFGRIQM